MCGKDMEYAGQEEGHKERARNGEVIETVHVFYVCEKCDTSVRLRFRKDGKEGDLWRTMKKRNAGHGRPVVTDFGGALGGIQG
jgi:hypothetical protein